MLSRAVAAALALGLVSGGDGEGSTCGCGSTSRRALGGGPGGGGDSGSCPAGAAAGDAAGTCALGGGAAAAAPAASRMSADDAPAPPFRVIRVPPGRTTAGTVKVKHSYVEDVESPPVPWAFEAPFWVDAFEVSNARFARFVGATGYVSEAQAFGWSFVHENATHPDTLAGITQSVKGSEWWVPVPNASWRFPRGLLHGDALATGLAHHPAVHVSKTDADAFCTWAGGRLPSEAEWEYAAHGGGSATHSFPWGSESGGDKLYAKDAAGATVHRANIWQGKFPYDNEALDGAAWTARVDAYGPQNGWGLYNVVGNAWEWTADEWCPPPGGVSLSSRRPLPPDCKRRPPQNGDPGEVEFVKKGGSFMCHKSFCYRYRVHARHHNTANSGAQNLGLRCVYDALPVDPLGGPVEEVVPPAPADSAEAAPRRHRRARA